jgi:ribonuclease G
VTARWVVEESPLADRAALIDGDEILAAHIALKADDHPQLGAVLAAKWHSPQRINAGERPAAAILTDAHGNELYLPRPSAGAGPGQTLTVEVVRERVWTPRSNKLAKARISEAAPTAAPTLAETFGVEPLSPYQPDALETAGWSELLEQAETGRVDGDGVRLWLDTTEAMTLIDIDGTLPPEDLAIAGAHLAARTIARLDIGGSIGIDFPTLASKTARNTAAEAFDAAMTGAFERTAINGYGFMQVIRPLLRPSIIAIMASPHAANENARRAWRADYDGHLTRR